MRKKPVIGRCDVCSAKVKIEHPFKVTAGGWYGGHEYRWNGVHFVLRRVRCSLHHPKGQAAGSPPAEGAETAFVFFLAP